MFEGRVDYSQPIPSNERRLSRWDGNELTIDREGRGHGHTVRGGEQRADHGRRHLVFRVQTALAPGGPGLGHNSTDDSTSKR